MVFSFLFHSDLTPWLDSIRKMNTYVEGDELYVKHWGHGETGLTLFRVASPGS